MGVALGELVGYQVRFTRQAGRATRIKLMTDGILLAEISHDRQLRRYDTIIIDEAHERSLNIDFLLGYLKQLLPARPDLKRDRHLGHHRHRPLRAHFDDAPVVEVSGRTYPWRFAIVPLSSPDDPSGDGIDQTDGIVAACRRAARRRSR